jgi:S-methylmethionine-dependent homocysteine/selenocysteine methylase
MCRTILRKGATIAELFHITAGINRLKLFGLSVNLIQFEECKNFFHQLHLSGCEGSIAAIFMNR